MRYVLVIYEGAADLPGEELEGATPLELARNVHASALMARSKAGLLLWPEDEPITRGEHALACLLGVVPSEARALKRGPVEAAGTAVDSARWTYAYRGNYVTTDGACIRDNRVSGLNRDETTWLTDALRTGLTDLHVRLEIVGPGKLSVMFDRLDGHIDPGEFPEVGGRIPPAMENPGNARLKLMKQSRDLLPSQSVNEIRLDLGENPGDLLWLWGGGAPAMISRAFLAAPLKGAMITNSPLARGMAALCEMSCHELGDVWADTTRPELMERDAITACINAHDLTVIYVEAPFEGGSFGTAINKVKSLDRLDTHVLPRILDAVARVPEARLMLTALPEEGVDMECTPLLLGGTRISADTVYRWDEQACNQGALGRLNAYRCLSRLIGE